MNYTPTPQTNTEYLRPATHMQMSLCAPSTQPKVPAVEPSHKMGGIFMSQPHTAAWAQ